jgi:hypothetical protein
MSRPTIWIADSPERLSFVKRLTEKLDYRWITDCLGETDEPSEPVDLIIISDERYFSWLSEKILLWRERKIPTLHVADGICEWRNIFDNPTFDRGDCATAPLYQPVQTDKIACLGRAQARVLESLGNLGKPEIVGLPRLDGIVPRTHHDGSPSRPKKICITSARNPGFTSVQKRQFLQGILDLKAWFKHVGAVLPNPLVPIWRLPDEYAEKLGLSNASSDMTGQTIVDALKECDALVSTPSTVVLEGMLLGLPCVLLDYYNTPLYFETAWRVSSLEQMNQVLPEVMTPPANKLFFQSYVLHDNLECRTPALPRMQKLIDAMIETGRQCRETGKALSFPPRLLADEQSNPDISEYLPPLGDLFPHIPALQETDLRNLQIQLVQARRLASERLGQCLQLEDKLRQQEQKR